MTPRARLVFAPEVRKELTPQVIEEARATIADYTCVACQGPGDARSELTSVVVIKPPNFPPLIRCGHNTCVQSHVADGTAVDPTVFDDAAVTVMKIAFGPGRDGLPVEAMMLVDLPRSLVAVTQAGDPTGLETGLFLSDGFELATGFDQPFPEVEDYKVHLNPDGSGHIDQTPGRPGHFLKYFNNDNPAGIWDATARTTGFLTVITGDLGITNAPPEHIESLVNQAFRTGNVVGGRIRIIQH